MAGMQNCAIHDLYNVLNRLVPVFQSGGFRISFVQ